MRVIHEEHDVQIREKTGLKHLLGRDGKFVGAELSDGSIIDIDFAIAGIGVTPNDRQLAKESGLEVANGIVVDESARTSDPSIRGRRLRGPSWQGGRIRLESVQNAVDQADAAAAVIAGGNTPYEPVGPGSGPINMTKLQIAGFNLGYDETLLRSARARARIRFGINQAGSSPSTRSTTPRPMSAARRCRNSA